MMIYKFVTVDRETVFPFLLSCLILTVGVYGKRLLVMNLMGLTGDISLCL
jgi:hypothetical protein